ncbi:unnamed protein product [Linum tenue]|uniref:Uncharacterized protein n=1 Tax=Linum tenue TaxID=586396 RepID=A0AAV0L8G2_9ROSI|nr:unnamed protein product [Linum tenue]
MANPGVGTSKFVSVNLNKSYGHQQQYHHTNQYHSGPSYGANRARPGGSGGGGGGMVVLSRPRSSQKTAGSKLSVPPPLNLPSLRKEHEKFDSAGVVGGHAGTGSGNGPRPSSSGIGWTKPAASQQEKEGLGVGGGDSSADNNAGQNLVVGQGSNEAVNGLSKARVYTPPSAPPRVSAASAPTQGYPVAEKVTMLRGEDFPSLQAALPVNTGLEKKQKDGFSQKQKQMQGEATGHREVDSSVMSSRVDMRPQFQSGSNAGSGVGESNGSNRGLGGSVISGNDRRQEDYFPGPLPLVRLNPRSDWADDERDIGHVVSERGRDHGFPRGEVYWDRDFDFPRPSVLPQKPLHNNNFDRRIRRDNETGTISSSEVIKVDVPSRDLRSSSIDGREGNSWRSSSSLSKDGYAGQEHGNDKNNNFRGKISTLNGDTTRDNKYVSSHSYADMGRKDVGYGQGMRQPWSSSSESAGSRGPEWMHRDRSGNEHHNRYRDDTHHNSSTQKSSFSSGGKGISVNDPIPNFGREKRSFSRSEKPYLEDPFMKDYGVGFDGRDPLSGALVGLVKKKKDVVKQTDFHDPVRDSFEAELERVQKMQEQERQRIIEEHERTMELARREEEERMRIARAQEEQQKRLEEEAREAAWRVEQERLEAIRRAEELRIAREEDKRRFLLEEERRRQAAKLKLLELEERMARRNAEGAEGGNNCSSGVVDESTMETAEETSASKLGDMSDWEEGERMVDRITTSASSDLPGMNRPFDLGSRPYFSRESSSVFMDRGKAMNPWKRDPFDNGNTSAFIPQDHGNHHSPRQDTSGGRGFPKREFYGGPGLLPSSAYPKGGILDPPTDDFGQFKGPRWNTSGEGDRYSRNLETGPDFSENFAERFGDESWGYGRPRGNFYPPYHERVYQSPESDGLYPFARPRYSMRQPRVLPPPSISSMQRSDFRGVNKHSGASSLVESERQYSQGARDEVTMQPRYDSSYTDNLSGAEAFGTLQDTRDNEVEKLERSAEICESQSSLSVSSPPDSPVQLSHDELDDSLGSPVSTSKGKDEALLRDMKESTALPTDVEKDNTISGTSVMSTGDDEEWAIDNDHQLQEQEEYDEEDGYGEEDEVHDGEEENINLTQEFESLHMEDKDSTDMVQNLVLGFNEGVEVKLPDDELERTSGNDEARFLVSQVPVESTDALGCCPGQSTQPVDSTSHSNAECSSRIFQDTEKGLHVLAIQSTSSPQSVAASELANKLDPSNSAGLSTQPQVLYSAAQTSTSSVPPASTQPEVPVKLQFGLFSGPSLIPSPVPAIQIGSIQMPLHLHPPVGPSLSHMHPSQAPLFQFGQLRYTSPISQGILPLGPQPMSFIQPTVPSNFSLNQNMVGSLPLQPGQDVSAQSFIKSDAMSLSMDNQPGITSRQSDLSQGILSKDKGNIVGNVQQSCGDPSQSIDIFPRPEPSLQLEDSFVKSLPRTGTVFSRSVSKEKDHPSMSRGAGVSTSSGRGKRYIFQMKNSGPRSSFQTPEASRIDSNVGFQRRPRRQRTEFRVRESFDKKQSIGVVSMQDDRSNIIGRGGGARGGSRRVFISNRQPKQSGDSEGFTSRPVSTREVDPGNRAGKAASGKEPLRKSQNIVHSGEDVDSSLQNGVVRVFDQPGIEAPSDDDDFIEVRSKRQMLNDRREQREKEIKAKARVSKIQRKDRSTSRNSFCVASSNKVTVAGETSNVIRSGALRQGNVLTDVEISVGITAPMVAQQLPPIGTPSLKTDAPAPAPTQSSSVVLVPDNGKKLVSGSMFDGNDKVLDNGQASLGSWGNPQLNQQVMALTQTQLDEAMQPGQFDSAPSVGDPSSAMDEPSLPSSSILSKEKPFSSSSAASPINSLLAGEKIQFGCTGAVTSPTILPPSSRAILPPVPSRSDIQLSHNLSAGEIDRSLFFEKEKLSSSKAGAHLDEGKAEAEAEAAASAVAVAAISNDEIDGSRLGSGPVSATDSKVYGGVPSDQPSTSHSRAEDSLSVALPADLSVENPPISFWPTLPSPHNSSSSQLLSHVPGGPHHFPFYEMNHPMLGGPIFAFGPHDEAAAQSQQSQKSINGSVSGPVGTWQHHSGVDSFYGPHPGFTGPFITPPPGSIPGVQGAPHMVVYNHFAPVGQFGQVGLSFMGTTYIPSGKQPDWKHNPASSPMGVGEAVDMINLNAAVSAQRNASNNMLPPIQHLAPGSPLMPMGSPLALFDVSPFQSPPDMPGQARWSHAPSSMLQSATVSAPLQHSQTEAVLPPQFSHGPAVDQSLASNRFTESHQQQQQQPVSDNGRNLTDSATTTRLPEVLGTSAGNSSTQATVTKISSDGGKTDGVKNNNSTVGPNFKPQQPHQKNTSYGGGSSGYNNYQRGGGVSQKSSSGGEWSHQRRMGYQGRSNQSLGTEKSYPSKMKQIYVAKQTSTTTTGTSSNGSS